MNDYRFHRFRRHMILDDMRFEDGVPPGSPFPDFDLPTTMGERVRKDDFVGRRPMLMVFASFT